jgi:Holliday junction resolvase RusA-like endonuclease
MKINLPLRIPLSRRRDFILNLNNYRNTHHRVAHEAKRNYTAIVWDLVNGEKAPDGPLQLTYRYFHGSKGKIDIANPCSIIDKFTCDALTLAGVWEDDDMRNVRKVTYEWGGVDKNRPRCELTIESYSD